MTSTSEIIIIFVLLVSYAASRMISSNATQKLDDEMKLRIFDGFSKRNSYSMIVIILVVFAFFVLSRYLPEYSSYITLAYAVVLAVYFMIKLFFNFRKLKEIGAPADYVRKIVLSWTVFMIGCGVIAMIGLVRITGY